MTRKILESVFHRYPESGSELSILLHYIDIDLNRDVKVRIVLYGVSNMIFSEFRVENIVDKLSINGTNEGEIKFEIEACAGIFGSCSCETRIVELVSAKSFP